MNNNNPPNNNVFADCVLHQEANGNYKPDYHYPSNGLLSIGTKPVLGFSMLFHLLNKGNHKIMQNLNIKSE